MRARSTRKRSPITKKFGHSRNFGNHVSASQGNQCEPLNFLVSVGPVTCVNLMIHIHIMVNSQLSKQGNRWPETHVHIAGSDRDHAFSADQLSVRNIPKFKDRANWSRDTFQPMRRRACVYQQTNQNIAPVIKNFQNNGRSRTESVIVSRFSGILLRLFMRHTQFFFKWTAYR